MTMYRGPLSGPELTSWSSWNLEGRFNPNRREPTPEERAMFPKMPTVISGTGGYSEFPKPDSTVQRRTSSPLVLSVNTPTATQLFPGDSYGSLPSDSDSWRQRAGDDAVLLWSQAAPVASAAAVDGTGRDISNQVIIGVIVAVLVALVIE